MHTTKSIDYAVVLNGTAALTLDKGPPVLLRAGDIVVQRGTRHGWTTPTNDPATMLFILIGSKNYQGVKEELSR